MRPLRNMSAEQIVSYAEAAAKEPIEEDKLLLAWAELIDFRKSRAKIKKRLRALIDPINIEPADWFGQAVSAARSITAQTRGGKGFSHHVYVILIRGFGNDGREVGLYVGESKYKPENRYQQHLDGVRAAGVVHRRGVCLLPCLFEHLNPLKRKEAKSLEAELAAAFVGAGVPQNRVKGGH